MGLGAYSRRSLTFSAFRMGAYSRWALIRGWAVIRINKVNTVRYFKLPLVILLAGVCFTLYTRFLKPLIFLQYNELYFPH